jgi:hypothetical protein
MSSRNNKTMLPHRTMTLQRQLNMPLHCKDSISTVSAYEAPHWGTGAAPSLLIIASLALGHSWDMQRDKTGKEHKASTSFQVQF